MAEIVPGVSSTNTGLLDLAVSMQRQRESITAPEERKARGQFFTPPSVAAFMAGLFSKPGKRLRILDAGAGVGALSAAVCERILPLHPARSVDFVLFESDSTIIRSLEKVLERCRTTLMEAGHAMTYRIEESDFVLSNQPQSRQTLLFKGSQQLRDFDWAIMNPPYFKLSRCSAHARAFQAVIAGQPNIYALFLAAAAEMLRSGGELVAITPRSFCSGLYFREFRRWFLERMTLKHIHLFESRTDTFRGAGILQESLITRFKKVPEPQGPVGLSSSHGGDLRGAERVRVYPASRIIDRNDGDLYIRIPVTRAASRIIDTVESWSARFIEHGLQISTGPVVTFRATPYLLAEDESPDAVPLIAPHNVTPFNTRWPVHKRYKPIAFRACRESEKLLLSTQNYVLLRRFSAKEEPRRLTASCLLSRDSRWPRRIAVENHVNYVYHVRRELTEEESLGIASVFNSALLDAYFRTISGSTQVNATEIRRMPFPTLPVLAELGVRVRALPSLDLHAIEQVVLETLQVAPRIAREIWEKLA